MVAGHEIHAIARAQAAQWFRVRRQALHAAVDQVARDGNRVRFQRVDLVDNGIQVGAFDGRAHVHVRNLRDRVAVQRCRQVADRHVHLHDARDPARVGIADQRHRQRDHWHRQRADVQHRGGDCANDHQRQQHQVAQHRRHQQRREQAHRQQADPGHGIGPAAPAHRGRHQPDRHQDAQQAQQ